MSDLETMIRAAAARGELTHVSLCAVAGKGPGGVAWSASYTPASKFGHGHAVHVDPVEAIKAAMTDTRLGKLVRKLEKTIADAPAAVREAAIEAVGAPPEPLTVDDSDFV